VRVGDDELGAVRQCRALEILEIADAHRCRRQIGEHLGACRGHGGDDFGADAGRNWPSATSRSGSAAMPTRRKPVMKWVSTIASCSCAR
jgi:hypothetical protein